MTDYMIADVHFGHQKVAGTRGFNSTFDHDATIFRNIVDTVGPEDTIWFAGDISCGKPADEDAAINIIAKIKEYTRAKIIIIFGNHDSAHPMHSKAHKQIGKFNAVFDAAMPRATMKINGGRAEVNHFPYEGDHTTPDRNIQDRPRDIGNVVIHGHTHSTQKVSYSPQGSIQICVSADAWDMKPASKDDITKVIKEAEQNRPTTN